MKAFKIIKNRAKRRVPQIDSQKESIIKELAVLLENRGVSLRREQLKQGAGFKVMSGTCRINQARFVLLDRRLPQNEQISFLVGKIIGHETRLSDDEISTLSDQTLNLFGIRTDASISCVS